MSGFTRSRLERLESRPGRPCPECGSFAGSYRGAFASPVTYEVVFDDDPSEEEAEFCPLCGRQTMATVTWGDEETPRGGG